MIAVKSFSGRILASGIAFLCGCAASPGRPPLSDDALITSRVKTAILEQPSLKLMQIGVETYRGDVQLSGFAGSPSEIRKAGEMARGIPGCEGSP